MVYPHFMSKKDVQGEAVYMRRYEFCDYELIKWRPVGGDKWYRVAYNNRQNRVAGFLRWVWKDLAAELLIEGDLSKC